jgi:hypothetical protein
MEKVNIITYNVLQNSSPQKPQDNAKHISNSAELKTIQQCWPQNIANKTLHIACLIDKSNEHCNHSQFFFEQIIVFGESYLINR